MRPGTATLRGPSGCPTTTAVAATVTGRRIVKVTFYVDNKNGAYSIAIIPGRSDRQLQSPFSFSDQTLQAGPQRIAIGEFTKDQHLDVGAPRQCLSPSALQPLKISAGLVEGVVVTVDHFGNLITNVTAESIGASHNLSAGSDDVPLLEAAGLPTADPRKSDRRGVLVFRCWLVYPIRQETRGRGREHAELHFGLTQLGVRGRKDRTAGERELEPAAEALTPDSDEDRRGELEHGENQCVQGSEHRRTAIG